jgi:hypothetical protein
VEDEVGVTYDIHGRSVEDEVGVTCDTWEKCGG